MVNFVFKSVKWSSIVLQRTGQRPSNQQLPWTKRAIPCHMCHYTGGIFFHLKQCKIPLLILNSSKHPTRFYSRPFPTLCIIILTFIPAVTLQECVEKALCVSQWKETAILVVFVTASKIRLPTKWTKRQYIICFQKRSANYTVPMFWTKMQFRRKNSKKAVSFV